MFIRPEALELIGAALDWLTDDFIAVFIDDGFVPDETTTARLDDVPSGNRQLTEPIGDKTATDGVLATSEPLSDPVTFPTPEVIITGFLLVHDTGVEATSEVMAWYDRNPGNAPIHLVTPPGPVRIQWPADTRGAGFITL